MFAADTGHGIPFISHPSCAAAANVGLTLLYSLTFLTTSALRGAHCRAASVAHSGTCSEARTACRHLGILSAGFTGLNSEEGCGNLGL